MANITALRALILNELGAYGAGLTAGGLHQLVKLAMPDVTLADVRDQLGALRDRDLVTFVENPVNPEDANLRQWTNTQKGELARRK